MREPVYKPHEYDIHTMYRFLLRPRWLALHVTVVATIALMINLGLWQLRRHHERVDFNKVVAARIESQPVELTKLLDEMRTGTIQPADAEWLNVMVSGQYLSAQTISAVNRSQGGVSGYDPLTPLKIGDSTSPTIILVNRGFLAQSVATPEPPVGEVKIYGRVRISETRRLGQISDPQDGILAEFITINLQRISRQIVNLNTDVYIEALESEPADFGELSLIAPPNFSNGPHLSYTAQWFIFSVFVASGWVVVVRRKIKSG